MKLPWNEVNEVDAAEIADILGLEPGGEKRKYRCPVHDGTSLHAYAEKGFFCYGCFQYWSVVDMAALVWSVEPAEACARLAIDLGLMRLDQYEPFHIRNSQISRGDGWTAPGSDVPKTVMVEQSRSDTDNHNLRDPSEVYAAVLANSDLTERGSSYLKTRALDPITAYDYGFRSLDTPQDWGNLAENLGTTFLQEELEQAGLAKLPWFGRVAALVIPYEFKGNVVGLRFRNINGEIKSGKYRTLKGVSIPFPFNADALLDCNGEELFVIEGELNAYTLHTRGHRAIGLPGAGIWKPEWTSYLQRVAYLITWYDDDDSGNRGVEKLAGLLQLGFGNSWMRKHARQIRTEFDANELQVQGVIDVLLEEKAWREC